jgi:hypothetical protein
MEMKSNRFIYEITSSLCKYDFETAAIASQFRLHKSLIDIIKMNGASPMSLNQGLKAGQQKIVFKYEARV